MDKNIWTIIPTGGEGTRLKPYTDGLSKPLVPVINNFPILEFVLYSLAYSAGLRKFIFGVKGTKHYINLQNYFQGGSGWSAKLEVKPQAHFEYQNPNYMDKGSADSVLYNIHEYQINSPVVVVQADNLCWGSDIKDLYDFALRSPYPITVGLTTVENPSNFGVVDFDEKTGMIRDFIEKPPLVGGAHTLVNTGIYVIKPEVFSSLELDFGRNVIPKLAKDQLAGGYIFKHPWFDFGNPQEHLKSVQSLLSKPTPCMFNFLKRVCTTYDSEKARVWIRGRSSFSLERALETIQRIEEKRINVEGNVFIGKDSVIEDGVYLKDSALGDLSFIGSNSRILNSNILDAWQVGKNCVIENSFFGRGGNLADGSVVEDTFIGHNQSST